MSVVIENLFEVHTGDTYILSDMRMDIQSMLVEKKSTEKLVVMSHKYPLTSSSELQTKISRLSHPPVCYMYGCELQAYYVKKRKVFSDLENMIVIEMPVDSYCFNCKN